MRTSTLDRFKACVLTLALTGLVAAGLAAPVFADSEVPPADSRWDAGTLVVIGLLVAAVVIVCVAVLWGTARSRKNRRLVEDLVAETPRADAPKGAGMPSEDERP